LPGYLERFDEPVITIDDKWRIAGLNLLAVQLLGAGAANSLGAPCHAVLQAADALTGSPCEKGCPGPLVSDVSWIRERRLTSAKLAGAGGQMWSTHVRCLVGSNVETLVFLSNRPPGRAPAEAPAADYSAITCVPALLRLADACDAARLVIEKAVEVAGASSGEVVIAGQGPDVDKAHTLATGGGDAAKVHVEHAGPNGVAGLLKLAARFGTPVIELADRQASDAVRPTFHKWLVSVPLQMPGRFLGAMIVRGSSERVKIGSTLSTLSLLANELTFFLRWAPQCQHSPAGLARRRLRVTTLGGLAVELDGRSIPLERFERKQGVELLKRLAAADGHSMTREEIRSAFWPDAPAQAGMASLRAVLHSLRRALGPGLPPGQESAFIRADGDRIGLRRDTVEVDIDEFMACHARCLELSRLGNRAEALRAGQAAIALYKGLFLADRERNDWSVAARFRLHETFMDTVRQVAVVLEETGDWEGAVATLHKAVLADPTREEPNLALIKGLWRAGEASRAREQYRRYASVARDALSLGPSPDMKELARMISATALVHAGNGAGKTGNTGRKDLRSILSTTRPRNLRRSARR
jgi:DNA-binding SARP family transcriptional activator